MGKCCDSLESRMSTSMYSSGFCLISSNTVMWNIYDGEWSTWIKFIKLHMKSRQSLGQRICREVLFTSIQIRHMNGLGAFGTKGGGIIGITIEYWLYSICICTWFKWLNTVVSRWKHLSRTLSWNCVVITVHETLFFTLLQLKRANAVTLRTLDNITCHRRVQAWNIRLYCYLT